MHKHLPAYQNNSVINFEQKNYGGRAIAPVSRVTRMGQPYTLTLKVVCKKCNETWMSDIEEKARPLLIPLLLGTQITLQPEDQIKLAHWFALKTMVMEHTNPKDAIISQDERNAFRKDREIPIGLKLWIGHHDCPPWYVGYFKEPAVLWIMTGIPTMPPPPISPPIGSPKTIQTTTLGLGHLLGMTFFGALSRFEFDFGLNPSGVILQAWPPTGADIHWPPLHTLTEQQVARVAFAVKELQARGAGPRPDGLRVVAVSL